MGTEILGEARKFTARGWVVHPLSPPILGDKTTGKKPLLEGWSKFKQATDEQLIKWFEKTNNNIGIACGKESGIVIIDMDKMTWLYALIPPQEADISKTLVSWRTTGRGHLYFQYDSELKNLKLHDLGIEILTDGSNAVIPPSIHFTGDKYAFKAEITPIKFPKIIKKNIELLHSFSGKVKQCRPCIRHVVFESNDSMHGNDGRRLMLMVATELKAQNVSVNEMLLYAQKVYGENFDSDRTKTEYRNCDESKTWKCETIRTEFPTLAMLCPECPIKQIDPDYIDIATKEKAADILQNGNPIDYILNTWNKIHVADISFGFVLMCSSLSASVVNSDGIQINFNGDSGGGKSHACRTMLHLIPKKYWSKKSLSNKALFYTTTIKSGMVLFSDDVILSDDLKTIYKNSVSDFQEQVEHETVDIQRKAITMTVPPQITWWLTAVSDPGNNEIERRNLKIVIDVNDKRYDSVSSRLMERKCKGEAKYPDYPEVFIARAIFSNVKATKEKIIIPYKIKFNHSVGLDTQNIIYELIFATTLMNKYKRQRTPEGELISTQEDFSLVIEHFAKISDTQISKLTKGELSVALFMKNNRGLIPSMTSEILQNHFDKSKGWVSQVFNGKNGNGGLLSKLPNIVEDDVSKKDESDTTRRKEYRFEGDFNEFSLYANIATISNGDKEDDLQVVSKEHIPISINGAVSTIIGSTIDSSKTPELKHVLEQGKRFETINRTKINTTNLTKFCLWFCEQNKLGIPNEIKAFAEKAFHITPEQATQPEKGEQYVSITGENMELIRE